MKIDPAATLRCWAVDVDVAGQTYTIPALPAAPWLLALVTGTYLDVVPGLLTIPDALDDQLADGLLGAECRTAARAAIAAASGTTWWTAARLARAIHDSWIIGEFTLFGVDPARVPLAAYLAAGYRAVTKYLDDQKRARLDMELDSPPPGVAPEEWWDEDAASAGFLAAMGRDHQPTS